MKFSIQLFVVIGLETKKKVEYLIKNSNPSAVDFVSFKRIHSIFNAFSITTSCFYFNIQCVTSVLISVSK
jgi:hypothetical protein